MTAPSAITFFRESQPTATSREADCAGANPAALTIFSLMI